MKMQGYSVSTKNIKIRFCYAIIIFPHSDSVILLLTYALINYNSMTNAIDIPVRMVNVQFGFELEGSATVIISLDA